MKRNFVLFLILILSFKAWSAELYEYNVTTRAHGMGGVYTPFPDASNAMWVNPAYLAYVEGIHWEFTNLHVGLNGQEAYQAFSQVPTFTTPAEYAALYGEKLWVGGHGHFSFATPKYAFGYFNHSTLLAGFDNPPFPDFNVEFYNDSGFQFSFATPLIENLALGFSFRQLRRWGGVSSVGLTSINAGTGVDLTTLFDNKGNALAMDWALSAKIPFLFSTTVNLVWKDFGTTTFAKIAGTDSPPRIVDNLILSAGTLMDMTGLDWRTGIEIRYLNQWNVQAGKKIHLGTELSLPLIDLRAGLSQGYQSLGIGTNLYVFTVDAAQYTVEVGDYPGQTPDERWEISLSLSMSIDADFSLNSIDAKTGKRRKLKQRR